MADGPETETLERNPTRTTAGSVQGSALHRSVEAAKRLRQELKVLIIGETRDPAGEIELTEEDQIALQDTFDGETTLDVEIRKAVLQIDDDTILISGIEKRMLELTDRKRRFEKRIEARRGLIAQAMTIAQWKKYEMDIGTVSVSPARPRVELDNESLLPSQFFKTKTEVVLDKAGLNKLVLGRHKAIEAAKAIPDDSARSEAIDKIEQQYGLPDDFDKAVHVDDSGVSLAIRRA